MTKAIKHSLPLHVVNLFVIFSYGPHMTILFLLLFMILSQSVCCCEIYYISKVEIMYAHIVAVLG